MIKYTDKRLREQSESAPCRKSIGYAQYSQETDGFPYLLICPFSIIKAHDRRCPICNTHNRKCTNIPHGIQHSHNAHIDIPAIDLKCRITYNLYQTVCKCHDKAGYSQTDDPQNPFPLQPHTAPFQMKHCPFSGQEYKNPYCRAKLRNDRRNSRSSYSQIQNKDKYRIQYYVQDCSDQNRYHPCISKALTVNKRIHSYRYHDKYRSQQIDPNIGACIWECIITCTKQIKNRLIKDQPDNRQYNSCSDQ